MGKKACQTVNKMAEWTAMHDDFNRFPAQNAAKRLGKTAKSTLKPSRTWFEQPGGEVITQRRGCSR
jgi:phage-related tail protein